MFTDNKNIVPKNERIDEDILWKEVSIELEIHLKKSLRDLTLERMRKKKNKNYVDDLTNAGKDTFYFFFNHDNPET